MRPGLAFRLGLLTMVVAALCGVPPEAGDRSAVRGGSVIGAGLLPLTAASVAPDPTDLRSKLDRSVERGEVRRAKHPWSPLVAVLAATSLLAALARGRTGHLLGATATGQARALGAGPRGPPSLLAS